MSRQTCAHASPCLCEVEALRAKLAAADKRAADANSIANVADRALRDADKRTEAAESSRDELAAQVQAQALQIVQLREKIITAKNSIDEGTGSKEQIISFVWMHLKEALALDTKDAEKMVAERDVDLALARRVVFAVRRTREIYEQVRPCDLGELWSALKQHDEADRARSEGERESDSKREG